jgi:pimeloyl-ACP methyl ester carboxylesterase
MNPSPSGPDTIILIHGFWVTPRSWEYWVKRYQDKGYRVLAPAYPGFEASSYRCCWITATARWAS